MLIDPFEEFQAHQREEQSREALREEIVRQGGTEDDRLTWTGKRIRGSDGQSKGEERQTVGKYLLAAAGADAGDDALQDVDTWEEPVKKKFKAGGFGNFDGW